QLLTNLSESKPESLYVVDSAQIDPEFSNRDTKPPPIDKILKGHLGPNLLALTLYDKLNRREKDFPVSAVRGNVVAAQATAAGEWIEYILHLTPDQVVPLLRKPNESDESIRAFADSVCLSTPGTGVPPGGAQVIPGADEDSVMVAATHASRAHASVTTEPA